MKKALLLTALFGFGLADAFAQSAATTCNTATPVCASTAITYPSTSSGAPAEVGPDYSCLLTQPNPSWFYFRIESAGNIIIDIEQIATAGGGVDVDYIIWGPFASPTAPCAGGLTAAYVESCSYSASYIETATVDSAIVGEYYIMLITNFSGMPANVTFSVNPASTGAISCTETCVTNASFNSPLCVGATMQLNATNHLGLGTYTWTGPGGFTSSLENPTISGVDGTNSGYYYLNYTRDTTCNYTDTVYVSVDTCGTLTGNVFGDENANCLMDTSEVSIGNVQMRLEQSGIFVAYAWTDVFGFYYFDVPPGVYTIEVLPSSSFPITCPGSMSHTTTVSASTITTENFAIDCGSFDVASFGVSVAGTAFFPGATMHMYPLTGSIGPDCSGTIPGEFILVLDPLVSYAGPYSTYPGPTSITTAATGDTLKWNVADVTALGYYGYLDFPFMYTTDVTATIGDTVHFTEILLPTAGDTDPSNNTYESSFIVGNSYDPNSKEVSPKGDGPSGFIPANTPELEYTINFQNMGTAPAHNIYILDTLGANVDVNTLHIITSSHLMTTTMMPGNILKFNFSNIMLADSASNEPASHGFVKFSIAPVAGLTPGQQIMNTAHIYFDFNPAVVTNTAINTIEFPSGINETNEYQLGVFPNPTNGIVNVVFEDKMSQAAGIKLMNVSGQLIYEEDSKDFNGKYTRTIDLSTQPQGIYMLEIKTDKQVVHKKIVRN